MTDAPNPSKRPRDVRLDFFRGVCLVIIYIAHIWNNPWASFIPARFGFSDATEIFVFCSGMASAVAFGSVFARRGVWIGAARIAHRCWQVYWSHVATFVIVAALMVAADKWLPSGGRYVAGLGLETALGDHARDALLGLVTLTFVPNFFDILPMYLVVLAMLPPVVALASYDKALAGMTLIVLWAVSATGILDLPAEPWSISTAEAKTWFFNPFSWQLIFFTGFAFMRGWIPAPPADRRLVVASAACLVMSIPVSWQVALGASDTLQAWNTALGPLIAKTRFGVLRFVHFLALAYLAYVAAGENGSRLRGTVVDWARQLGQQSLAVFMTGLVLSFAGSILLNMAGRSILSCAVVNLGGIAILVFTARAVAWFKSSPWLSEPGTYRQVTGGRAPMATPRKEAPPHNPAAAV